MKLKVKYLILLTQLLQLLLLLLKNKICNVNKLARKPDCNTKISEIENEINYHDHDKYIASPEFNNLTAETFAARLKQTNLASESDIVYFIKRQTLVIN